MALRVSIAMATYNGERYLEAQLASFAAQTLAPDELVVCDDASSDGTCRIVEQFVSVAPFPVRLHTSPTNLGLRENFERAIGLADGDVIFLSDQDDVWLADKLQSMVTALDNDPSAMVVTCDQELTDPDLVPTGEKSFAQFKSLGKRGSPFAVGCCSALRDSFRLALLPIPTAVPAHDMWLDSLSDALNVRRCLPQPLQYHRRHGRNVTPDYLNPTSPVVLSQHVHSALQADAYSGCQRRIMMLDLTVDRLESLSRSELPQFAQTDWKAAIGGLGRERLAISRRQALLRRPRLERLGPALMMASRGDYRYFSGLKSLAKDLIWSASVPADT